MDAPPGWYPDPRVALQMRWWDGTAWTDDVYQRTEPLTLEPLTLEPQVARSATAQPVRGAGAVAGPTTDDGVPLAGWGRRCAARLIDLSVVTVLSWLVGWQQSAVALRDIAAQSAEAQRAYDAGHSGFVVPDYAPATERAFAVLGLLFLLVAVVYQAVFLLWRAATPGKLALGLRVRRWAPGQPLRLSVVVARWLGLEVVASLPVVGIGLAAAGVLWPLRDRRRRGWHDLLAGTVVVHPDRRDDAGVTAPE